MKTNSLIAAFRTWDGNAWLRYHLNALKTAYQGNQHIKQGLLKEEAVEPAKRRPKQPPYVNYAKAERKHMKLNFSHRQLKKIQRDNLLAV